MAPEPEPTVELEREPSALEAYGRDLTEEAEAGSLDPVIGRDSEIRNLQITGNDIEYNTNRVHRKQFPDGDEAPTGEIYIDVGSGTIREGTIASNTIQARYSPNGANIRMIGSGPEGTHRAGMWTIAGNLIGSQKNNVHLTGVRGITISGNYIYSGHARNVLVEGSRNVVLGENTFGHNPDYRGKELATGIRLSRRVFDERLVSRKRVPS